MNGEDGMPTDTALARVSLWGMHSDYQPRVWELSYSAIGLKARLCHILS